MNFPPVNFPVVGMERIQLPKMIRISQEYDRQRLDDAPQTLVQQLESHPELLCNIRQKRIAITVGSRGIHGLAELLKALCDELKRWGAEPFLVPAMGSHGGATAEGQLEVLESFGITQEQIGVPVQSSMDVIQYGTLEGTPLYCDRAAYEADGVVILNKVKPHTDFRGDVESGLCKMIAIGLGKHAGASAIHARGYADFARFLPMVAQSFLNTGKVCFGIGVVQNAYSDLCALQVTAPENLIETDKALLKLARKRLATLKCKELDVLVLDEIGKNISGFGFDPNVVGRMNSGLSGFSDILKLQRFVILGLSEETHHNGCGISAADVTTRQCLQDIDWDVVWTNMTTSLMINGGKIPLYMNQDYDALRLAVRTCAGIDYSKVRLAHAKNTGELFEIEVSESLFDILKDRPDVHYIEGPYEWEFDAWGNLFSRL